MKTTACAQQRYDHRLRDLVHATGDVTIATDLGVYCWGLRRSSGLGNGELDHQALPVAMTGGFRFLLYEPGTVNLMGLRARPSSPGA